MAHALKPIDPENLKESRPYAVWDIETSHWTKFLVAGFFDGSHFRSYRRMSTFLSDLFDRYDGWDIFAHFGGRYDHLFALRALLSEIHRGVEFELGALIPRGSGIFCFDATRTKDGKQSTVRFYDSSALLPFALARITENFGVTHVKQQIDYSKITKVTPELLEYLEYDCRGLYESLTAFFSWPLVKSCGRSYSLASQSLRVLRTFIKKPIAALKADLDLSIRRGYFGGRVEIFRLVKEPSGKKLRCYDVNSLYPFVMRNNEFPNAFQYETDSFENKPGFWQCEIDTPKVHIPALGIVHKKKYIFPTGTYEAFISTPEVLYLRSLGYKVHVTHGHVFSNAGKIFEEFVDTLYEIREKSKKDSVDNTIAKLLLNSCYGRFGLNHRKEQLVFDEGQTGLKFVGGEEIILNVDGKNFRLMTKGVEIETFSNVAIASYVTAYARIHMHRQLEACGDDIYYTDTDSLFTTRELPTGRGLGELKLEYECGSACFLLPKTYVAEGVEGKVSKKIVMKGFDKKKISGFTYDDFLQCLQGDLKRLRVVQEPKFATFKTAVRMGKLVTMTKASHRQIRSQYDKRIVLKDWSTKPIEVNANG